MRFLFLTFGYSADGSRSDLLQQLAEELASKGHGADVISMGMDGGSQAGPQPESFPRLRAFVLGAPPPWAPRVGPLKYIPNIWRLNLNKALGRWLNGPYDGFLFATPGVMSAGAGARLKRAGVVKKSAFLLWDFFPVAHSEAGSLSLGPAESVAYRIERRVARSSDVLFATSAAGASYAHDYYQLPSARIEILPPWGRPSTGSYPAAKFERFTCVWGGQFIARRAIPDLIEAARILEMEGADVDFHLAGDGPLLAESRKAVETLGLESVHFDGRLSRDRYQDLLRRSHVGLSAIEAGSSPSFPSKTADYCQAGLPLVASVEECNDYGQILADAGVGVAVEAGDAAGIADAIRWLANAPQEHMDVMARASHRFFDEHLSVEAAARNIEEVLSG